MKPNTSRIRLGQSLAKHSKSSGQPIWKSVSETILSSRKNRPEVNLSSISKSSKEGSRVVVPGKVLGSGTIDHKVTVAALSFSESAKQKIKATGGECFSLQDFMENTKEVKDVVLLG